MSSTDTRRDEEQTVEYVIASIGHSALEVQMLAQMEPAKKTLVLAINSRLTELELLAGWDRPTLLQAIGCKGWDGLEELGTRQLRRSLNFLGLATKVAAQSESGSGAQVVIEFATDLYQQYRSIAKTALALGFPEHIVRSETERTKLETERTRLEKSPMQWKFGRLGDHTPGAIAAQGRRKDAWHAIKP